MKTQTDNLKKQEEILVLYWKHYNKCLEITNNSEADEQEFIELGKAVNQWRLQTILVDNLKKEIRDANK
jgi:hypothetical protein